MGQHEQRPHQATENRRAPGLAHLGIAPNSGGVMNEKKPHSKEQGLAVGAGAKFTGTSNPRQLRALAVLLRRPVSREQLDAIAGASNSPQLVSELRARGLHSDLLCSRVEAFDRDGRPVRPGVYSLTNRGKRLVYSWLTRRDAEGGAKP